MDSFKLIIQKFHEKFLKLFVSMLLYTEQPSLWHHQLIICLLYNHICPSFTKKVWFIKSIWYNVTSRQNTCVVEWARLNLYLCMVFSLRWALPHPGRCGKKFRLVFSLQRRSSKWQRLSNNIQYKLAHALIILS